MNGKKKGFTLIELLVVVLIIGILAAIALPQYQKAVLKSRYTTLMPIAKGIAEGNEAYFMEHGTYAEDPTELPIKGQESYPDGTTLDLQDTDEYTYVLASRADLPGLHHIIYQHHSKNFPSETHCEAAKDNKLANWVCKDAFKGTKITGSLNSGYYSYVLEGSGSGTAATTAAVLAEKACPENTDEDHCNTTTHADGSTTKKECTDPSDTTTCTWTTIDEEGTTKTICNGSLSTYENNTCLPRDGVWSNCFDGTCANPYEVVKDEDGNIIAQTGCNARGSANSPGCTYIVSLTSLDDGGYKEYGYSCSRGSSITAEGCNNGGTASTSSNVYDADGAWVSSRTCASGAATLSGCSSYEGGYDYTYDEDRRKTSERTCASGSVPLEGNCTSYTAGKDYVYDEQGRTVANRTCKSGTIPATGNCTVFQSGTEKTYDTRGNTTSERTCANGATLVDGKCSTYSSGTDYSYNSHGRPTATRNCQIVNGACSNYSSGTETTYTYDSADRESYEMYNCSKYENKICKTSTLTGRQVQHYDDNGVYTGYTNAVDAGILHWVITHDSNGNQTSFNSCSAGVNLETMTCK